MIQLTGFESNAKYYVRAADIDTFHQCFTEEGKEDGSMVYLRKNINGRAAKNMYRVKETCDELLLGILQEAELTSVLNA